MLKHKYDGYDELNKQLNNKEITKKESGKIDISSRIIGIISKGGKIITKCFAEGRR